MKRRNKMKEQNGMFEILFFPLTATAFHHHYSPSLPHLLFLSLFLVIIIISLILSTLVHLHKQLAGCNRFMLIVFILYCWRSFIKGLLPGDDEDEVS